MMLYKSTKEMVRLPDGDTNFDIVAGVLQGNTLAPFRFLIGQDCMKENGLTLKKRKSRKYPTEAITDADNTDYLALLTNTPGQAKSQLHKLEQAARGIGLYINADKTVFTYFKQDGVIFILNAFKASRVVHIPR